MPTICHAIFKNKKKDTQTKYSNIKNIFVINKIFLAIHFVSLANDCIKQNLNYESETGRQLSSSQRGSNLRFLLNHCNFDKEIRPFFFLKES